MDLTARQIQCLQLNIQIRRIKYRYPMQKFLADIQGAKMKSLEEILGVLDETPKVDPELDKLLDEKMKRHFERLNNG